MGYRIPFNAKRGDNQIVIATDFSQSMPIDPRCKSVRCVNEYNRDVDLGGTLNFTRNYVAYSESTTQAGVRIYNSVAANVLRLSTRLDAGGTLRTGYQLEPQRNNGCLESNFQASWAVSNVVKTVAQADGPLGALTMCSVTIANGTFALPRIDSGYSWNPVAGTRYASSVFIKAGQKTFITFRPGATASGLAHVNFNLITGAWVNVNNVAENCWMEDWGGGVKRVIIISTATLSASTGCGLISGVDSAVTTNGTGDGATVSFYASQFQTEVGDYPSSPIITTVAAATRLADVMSYTSLDIGNHGSNRKGTLEYEFLLPSYDILTAQNLIRVNDGGAAADEIKLGLTTADLLVMTEAATGEAGCTITNVADVVNNVAHKALIIYENDKIQLFIDGVFIGQSVVCGDMPDDLDSVYLDTNMGLVWNIKVSQGDIVHVRAGKAPQMATTADTPIMAGQEIILHKLDNSDELAYITEGGTATLHIQCGEGGH